MKMDTNKHSVFLLNYHLVLVVKYRRKVIDEDVSEFARQTFERIGASYHITLIEWNHDGDHIHVLFKAHPNTEMSKFLNAYKSASSRLIKRDFPHVKEDCGKKMFWSRSYCLVTTGGDDQTSSRQYIEKQGK